MNGHDVLRTIEKGARHVASTTTDPHSVAAVEANAHPAAMIAQRAVDRDVMIVMIVQAAATAVMAASAKEARHPQENRPTIRRKGWYA